MKVTEEEYARLANRLKKVPAADENPKRNKYGNVKKLVNGLEFDSTKEARHFQDLHAEQQAGNITELRRQVSIDIEVNGHYIGFYVADFTYKRNGKLVVEDVKSKATKTDTYRWKKKLVFAIHGIEIQEV